MRSGSTRGVPGGHGRGRPGGGSGGRAPRTCRLPAPSGYLPRRGPAGPASRVLTAGAPRDGASRGAASGLGPARGCGRGRHGPGATSAGARRSSPRPGALRASDLRPGAADGVPAARRRRGAPARRGLVVRLHGDPLDLPQRVSTALSHPSQCISQTLTSTRSPAPRHGTSVGGRLPGGGGSITGAAAVRGGGSLPVRAAGAGEEDAEEQGRPGRGGPGGAHGGAGVSTTARREARGPRPARWGEGRTHLRRGAPVPAPGVPAYRRSPRARDPGRPGVRRPRPRGAGPPGPVRIRRRPRGAARAARRGPEPPRRPGRPAPEAGPPPSGSPAVGPPRSAVHPQSSTDASGSSSACSRFSLVLGRRVRHLRPLAGEHGAGYQPEQPIYFPHSVMAGKHQIAVPLLPRERGEGRARGDPPALRLHEVPRGDPDPGLAGAGEGLDPGPARRLGAARSRSAWEKVHDLAGLRLLRPQPPPDRRRPASSARTATATVRQMDRVERVNSLKMGWCLDCHRQPPPEGSPPGQTTRAPIHCSTCHR